MASMCLNTHWLLSLRLFASGQQGPDFNQVLSKLQGIQDVLSPYKAATEPAQVGEGLGRSCLLSVVAGFGRAPSE